MQGELKETTALRAKWFAAHKALHDAMEAEAEKEPWLAALRDELFSLGEITSVRFAKVSANSSPEHLQRVRRYKHLSRRWQQYIEADPRLRLLQIERDDLHAEFDVHWDNCRAP